MKLEMQLVMVNIGSFGKKDAIPEPEILGDLLQMNA